MGELGATRREARLVLRAQTGDRPALDRLLMQTQDWLHRYLCMLLKNTHGADEVLQEVFLQVFRYLRNLENPLVYRAWVYRIATRQAFRHIKNEAGRSERIAGDDELAHAPAPDWVEPPDAELLSRIRGQIEQMPPNTRAVVVLHYFEELSIRQAADVLGISVGTAKSRLAYALVWLRDKNPTEEV